MAPREAIRARDMAPSDSRVMKVLPSGPLPMQGRHLNTLDYEPIGLLWIQGC